MSSLILFNGRFETLDDSWRRPEALSVENGRIAGLGNLRELRSRLPKAELIDLRGGLACPGLIDGHAHFLKLGLSKLRLELGKLKSFEELLEKISLAAEKLPKGSWVVGRGWHQEDWKVGDKADGSYPTHHEISKRCPEHPVLLIHSSGHMLLANELAMRKSGFAIPQDGCDKCIGKDGLFYENEMTPLLRLMKSELEKRPDHVKDAEFRKAVESAAKECLRNGITCVHDAGLGFKEIEMLSRLDIGGALKLTIYAMLGEDDGPLESGLDELTARSGKFLSVRAIKRIMDGAMGAHSAWLIEPYSDKNETCGMPLMSKESLRKTALIAARHSCQLCTHAIGDMAVRETLDAYESVFAEIPSAKNLRWRIEHAQHISPIDIPRFGKLGVIAMMQGSLCRADIPWIKKRLGEERCRTGAWAFRSLLDSGARIGASTDSPVTTISPLINLHSMIARKGDDMQSFFPEQAMTHAEALSAYTMENAFASFMENEIGSLSPGKKADITVFSKDWLSLPPDEILNTGIAMTIVDGKIAWRPQWL